MRRFLACLALAALAVTSCGAQLRLTATMPLYDNAGTCAAPVLMPASSSNRGSVTFSWTGPDVGTLEVPNLAPGDTIYGQAQDGVSIVLYLPGTEIV